MAGDDANPAVPGYDPDIAAELYTTNGDIDTHMQAEYGTLGFTPEMSTCEAASASVPDDEWEADDCNSGFEFPDDEDLIQAEFEKNIPFALAVAESAVDPDDPVSVVGREAEPFRVDSFDVSYGDPQTVAVTAKRAVRNVRMYYRINDGRTERATVREWDGGERYGFENDDYYVELRGEVQGAEPGRHGRGLVLRRGRRPQPARRQRPGRERAVHVHRRPGHRPTRARHRQRGPHRRQPRADASRRAAEVPRRAPRRAGRQRRRPRTCGTSTPTACPTTSAC